MKSCPACGLQYPDDNERCFVDKHILEAVRDPRIGMLLLGRYMIEHVLGQGGMATVYRARNTLVEHAVAVKVMNPHLNRDAALKERFRREAKNAAAVAHPNIVEIYDYGETEDGTPFLVMELLDGQPLGELIAQGPIPAPDVAAIGVQVARGLARAHDFAVLHRDLKPENIFLCTGPDGRRNVAKILDFGIARSMHDTRLTNAGEIFGTPQYMAPERVTSTDAGPSADLYALGVILFEMLTGRLPFESRELPGFFIKHMTEPPPRPSELVPDVPRPLEELVLALLAKQPEQRPVDAHAVVKALEPLVPKGLEPATASARGWNTRAVQAAPTAPSSTADRWAQRLAIFEQMLERAFPQREVPRDLVSALEEMRRTLARIHELRSVGLTEQRNLEQLEAHAQEARERLGHAVHVLAEDLSNAREAERAAQRETAPYYDADAQARDVYVRAHERLIALGGARVFEQPTDTLVEALRETAESFERWRLSRGAAEEAQRWVEAKRREVKDLSFQVDALRQQLDRVEARYEAERAASQEVLRRNGEEVSRLEQRLTELGARFVEPLRSLGALGELFAQLERDGTPAAGILRPT